MRQPPIALEVLDGLQYEVPDAKPDNDEADEEYVPGEYYENSDHDDDNDDDECDGGRDNDIDPPQEPANIDTDYNDNAGVILNPSGSDHFSPIVGMTTYHD